MTASPPNEATTCQVVITYREPSFQACQEGIPPRPFQIHFDLEAVTPSEAIGKALLRFERLAEASSVRWKREIVRVDVRGLPETPNTDQGRQVRSNVELSAGQPWGWRRWLLAAAAALGLLVLSWQGGTHQRPSTGANSASQTSERTVYVTATGQKYHRSGCQYLRLSEYPMALSQAQMRYDPCKVCRPSRD